MNPNSTGDVKDRGEEDGYSRGRDDDGGGDGFGPDASGGSGDRGGGGGDGGGGGQQGRHRKPHHARRAAPGGNQVGWLGRPVTVSRNSLRAIEFILGDRGSGSFT